MEETFLASFVVVVFDLLTSDELLNVATQLGIKPHLKKWKKNLEKILTVLADAELKQYGNTNVKKWLNKLEDLAYDMDDTIDGFVTDQLGKRPHSQASSSSSQASSNQFSSSTDLENKMDEISKRLEKIVGKINGLSLKENNNNFEGIQLPSSTAWERFPSSSLAQPHVYGREEEEEAILEILLEDDEASFDPKCVDKWVVPIVGMGGLGKTTLAQLLYNDKEVNSFFDLRVWVCVGFVAGKFDVLGVTKKILESLTRADCNLNEFDKVEVRLTEKLSGKKFLVVLDDIWKIECDEWDILKRPFFSGARGSKIIVTTRSADVAKNMSRIKIRELKPLGHDHSLSLLARQALERESFEEHRDLKEIGEKILKKCKGLPLAIKTIGGLLRTKKHQSQWEYILHSEVWDLEGPILPALLLSYRYLPSHLKRCFGACAIIPKDCAFSKKELILLWMAMGLLRGQSRKMNYVEDFGSRCFDELLSRSFFQNSARSESQFIIHDLIIDVAEFVAGEICCRWGETKISKRARYSSFIGEAPVVFENFEDFNSVQQLRTFVPIGEYNYSSLFSDNEVWVELVRKFKFLRALSLAGWYDTMLPGYIGELKHLRHLDLCFSNVQVLPASICTLYNLLTLSVKHCLYLHNLPADIGNLINLRHLENADTVRLKEMPCGISKLRSLQTLTKFVVGKGSGLKLRELKDLMLRGSLSIYGLEDVMDSQDAEDASLKLKHDLDKLELVWKFAHHHDEELEFDVLDKLKPQRNLKKLKIDGYRCSEISSWVGDPSFRELTEISIINCRNCTSLPPLWELPMLKHLHIEKMFELRSIGVQFYIDCRSSEFSIPSLERLYFDDMPKWEEWSICRGGAEVRSLFPCLRELSMRNCPKLTRIPVMALPSLSYLRLDNCHGSVLESLSNVTSLPNYSANISNLDVFIRSMSSLNIESLQNFQNLGSLRMEGCDGLESFPESGWAAISKLRDLQIRDCCNFKSLRFNQIQRNHRVSLEMLVIFGCPKLETFPDGDLPPNLTSLHVRNCGEHLKPLSEWGLHKLASFDQFVLSNYYGDDQQFLLPSTLTRLEIEGLPNLESLSNGLQNLSSLKSLAIENCPKLRSLPEGEVLSNLSTLYIDSCPILEKRIKYEGYYQPILDNIPMVRYN